MQFSTGSIPLMQRLDGYESALRDYFSAIAFSAEVAVADARPDSFSASLERLEIGQMIGAIHCCNSPHSLHAKPVAAEPGVDFYFVRSGNITFHGDDGELDLRAGDMMLMRSDVEFSAQSKHMEIIALGLPEHLARDPALARRWVLGRRIPGDVGFGACLVSLLSTAAARQHELRQAEGAVLQSAVMNSILLLGLEDEASVESSRTLSARQVEKLSQLKTLALQCLPDPNLTPAALAHESAVSIRTLHRLFNGSGLSFRSWLRQSRLERCWMDLTDAGARQGTIASIAFRWGFNDLQTFNRAFSARYGMTPQAAREMGRRGISV